MQRIKLNLLRLDYLLGTAIIFCQVSGRFGLTSVFFYGTFFATFFLWLCTLTERVEKSDIIAIFIIFVSFINVVLNGVFNGILAGASFSFSYIKKYIMFCCTIMFFAATIKIEITNKTRCFFEYIYLCVGAFLVFMYCIQNREMHILNGYYSNYLTFRFTNPNLTALFFACMIMFLVVVSFQEKRVFWKCILLATAVAEIIFLYQTRSRNCMLAIAVFLCLALLQFLKKKELKLKNWMLWLIAVAPLLFAIIYIEIIHNPLFTKLFSFAVSEGKGLDSRIFIWRNAFSAFAASPIFGAYFQISNGTGVFQLHNTHVDILTSYGFIVLMLVCVFLHGLMGSMQKKSRSREHSIALIGFACAVLLGVGEAAVFSGGLGIYLFAGVFLLTQKPSTASTHQL